MYRQGLLAKHSMPSGFFSFSPMENMFLNFIDKFLKF